MNCLFIVRIAHLLIFGQKKSYSLRKPMNEFPALKYAHSTWASSCTELQCSQIRTFHMGLMLILYRVTVQSNTHIPHGPHPVQSYSAVKYAHSTWASSSTELQCSLIRNLTCTSCYQSYIQCSQTSSFHLRFCLMLPELQSRPYAFFLTMHPIW